VRIDSFDPTAPNYNEGLVKSLVRARRIITPAHPMQP
jgi:hypothetical protein